MREWGCRTGRRGAYGVGIAALLAAASAVAAPAPQGAAAPAVCGGTFAVHDVSRADFGRPSTSFQWASLAVADANRQHGTRFRVVRRAGDNTEESARGIARGIVATPGIVGIVGFQTSRTTAAAGPILDRGRLAYVSQAATRTSLADGSLTGFFRVLAADNLQGPAMARVIANTLGGTSVAVISQDDPYSTDLAASISGALRDRGIATTGLSAPISASSYADVVAAIPAGTDVIALPFISLNDAVRFAADARAAGVTAAIIGGDAVFASTNAIPGAYVTAPTGSIMSTTFGRGVAARYRARYGAVDGAYPTAYTAASALAAAGRAACAADGRATRAGIRREMRRVRISPALFGRPVSFLANGNLRDATNYLWRVGPSGPEYVGVAPASPVRSPAQVLGDRASTGRQLTQAYSDLLVARDTAGLRAVLAANFIVQRADGSWADRSAFLARPPDLRAYALSDVVSRRSGATLTARMTATSTLMVGGAAYRSAPSPLLTTWRWTGARWQLVSQGNFNLPQGR